MGRTRNPAATPGQRKAEWAENLLGKLIMAPSIPLESPWVETSAEQREQHCSRKRLKKQHETQVESISQQNGTLCGPSTRGNQAVTLLQHSQPRSFIRDHDIYVVSQSRELIGNPARHRKNRTRRFSLQAAGPTDHLTGVSLWMA